MYNDEDGLIQSGDKRRHSRFATRHKALYYLSDEQGGLKKCEIVNVSYGGVGLQFKQAEALKDSAAINLGVMVRWQIMPISLKGRVRWLRKGPDQPVGGVELEVPLSNMALLKLL